MDLADSEIGFEWNRLSAQIDALVSCVAGWRIRRLPLAASALLGDDRAVAPESLTMDMRRLIERSASYLHACRELITRGEPIEEGPGFVLIRACVETAAAAYWILSMNRRDERLERYLQWKVADLRDAKNAWARVNDSEGAKYDDVINKLKMLAKSRDGIDPRKVDNHLGSTLIIKEVSRDLDTTPNLLFCWQVASAFAHGRNWSDISLQVLPLDVGERSTITLTAIPSRTFPFAHSARLLCDASVDVFMARAGLTYNYTDGRRNQVGKLFRGTGHA